MVKCFACQLGPILWVAPAAYIIFLAPSFYFAVRKRDLKSLYKKTLEQHSLEDEKIKPSVCFAMRVLCWISPAREISSPRSVHSELNRSSGVVFFAYVTAGNRQVQAVEGGDSLSRRRSCNSRRIFNIGFRRADPASRCEIFAEM